MPDWEGSSMWKKGINFVFVGLILCGLLLGLARTVFFPKKINYYENRYANRAALPTPGTYADGTFQDQLEAALGDQTPFAERFKARYNDLSSKLTKALLKPVLESGRYYRIGDVQLFSDYLTYHTRDLEKLRPTLEERAANYNAIFAAHPDIEFFVCYIEKDTDINFETGERVYADDLLFSMLNLPENRMLKYEIPDFAAFSEYFYRTDHHWTSLGAFYGANAVLSALGRPTLDQADFTPQVVSDDFNGTLYSTSGIHWLTPDEMEYWVEEDGISVTSWRTGSPEPAALYDRSYLEKKDKYSSFLGGNQPLCVLKNEHNPDGGKILLVRDSYSDSLAPFLAQSFSEVHLLDLRYYRAPVAQYAAENGIDEIVVLYSVPNFITDRNLVLLTQ